MRQMLNQLSPTLSREEVAQQMVTDEKTTPELYTTIHEYSTSAQMYSAFRLLPSSKNLKVKLVWRFPFFFFSGGSSFTILSSDFEAVGDPTDFLSFWYESLLKIICKEDGFK